MKAEAMVPTLSNIEFEPLIPTCTYELLVWRYNFLQWRQVHSGGNTERILFKGSQTLKRIRQKSAFYLYDHWRRVPGKFLEMLLVSSDRKESAEFIVAAFSVLNPTMNNAMKAR